MYLFILFSLLSLSNYYMVWLLMEIMFLFFLLVVINYENKRVGLIIYFFFQRTISLFLFIMIVLSFDKIIFILLTAKLGLFPFFYWIVVVSVKVGILGNIFVLGLQKISVFWIIWLLINVSMNFVYLLVYLSLLFVVIRLVMVTDLWLLLVYSSIANTSIIVLRVFGNKFVFIFLLYLFTIIRIIYFIKSIDSYLELILIVFIFLVIPPFLLFFIKFYVFLSLENVIKLGFFLSFLDVLVLLYYFRLIFVKFILMDLGILIYIINLLLCLCVLLFRNCVAMIIFDKS